MILKALDLLRELGWGIISLIYNFIDAIYGIISKVNELDIVSTMAENSVFSNLYSAIVTIAITIFSLFVIWQFVKKIIDPTEGPSINQIISETIKCGVLLLVSTFLFIQVSNFSIQLSGYVGSVVSSENNTSLGTELLINYVEYADDYTNSDKFDNDDYLGQLKDGSFSINQHYNDKYVVKERFIRSDERDYKYKIQWVMAILCGGFFLYALVFSAIMLARRQIEFIFLFLISPLIYATSVCNKQRRGALIEQLVSLTLQAAVVMLIINVTALLATQINTTKFFDVSFQDMATKSLLYLGCATFLLTGSQVINKFIGANISASSGREQLMSLMGYGKLASGAAKLGGTPLLGASMLGAAGILKGGNFLAKKSGIAAKTGSFANNLVSNMGAGIAAFGDSFGNLSFPDGNIIDSGKRLARLGDSIRTHGLNISTAANMRNANNLGIGVNKKVSSATSSVIKKGINMISPLKINRGGK